MPARKMGSKAAARTNELHNQARKQREQTPEPQNPLLNPTETYMKKLLFREKNVYGISPELRSKMLYDLRPDENFEQNL